MLISPASLTQLPFPRPLPLPLEQRSLSPTCCMCSARRQPCADVASETVWDWNSLGQLWSQIQTRSALALASAAPPLSLMRQLDESKFSAAAQLAPSSNFQVSGRHSLGRSQRRIGGISQRRLQRPAPSLALGAQLELSLPSSRRGGEGHVACAMYHVASDAHPRSR